MVARLCFPTSRVLPFVGRRYTAALDQGRALVDDAGRIGQQTLGITNIALGEVGEARESATAWSGQCGLFGFSASTSAPCTPPPRLFRREFGSGLSSASTPSEHGEWRMNSIPMGSNLVQVYRSLKDKGHVREDFAQNEAIERLELLQSALEEEIEGAKGLYIQGGVGCGKTFCMDLFFQCLNVEKKSRVHFHSFMLGIHRRLFELQKLRGQDPLITVAREIADDSSVICFDEFQVTDVADAMILKRLLETLIDNDVVFVMTSNRMPDELYLNGLNRVQFLPAIELIKSHCDIFPFPVESPDYRLMGQVSKTWMTPIDPTTNRLFDETYQKLTRSKKIRAGVLDVQGRRVEVPSAAGGVARFSFHDLCQQAKGAADYIAIANSYHTIFLEGIPELNENKLPFVRRFITLVDVFYENHVKVIALAECSVDQTYVPGEANHTRDEDFAWDRTVSRLTEMQSDEYLSDPWRGGSGFLRKMEIEGINGEDLKRIWDVYDTNNDGHLSQEELAALMADVNEVKSGRRFVDENEVGKLLRNLKSENGENGDSKVSREDFLAYFKRNGGLLHVIESHYHL